MRKERQFRKEFLSEMEASYIEQRFLEKGKSQKSSEGEAR